MICIASGHVISLSLGRKNVQRLDISSFAIYLSPLGRTYQELFYHSTAMRYLFGSSLFAFDSLY
jgi:hypothetical protein